MKRSYYALVLILLVLLSFTSVALPLSTETPIRVLFVGNSYTYFNNLPGVLSEFGTSEGSGHQIVTEMVVAGGATLKQHFEGSRAVSKIRKGNWDYVVLQEQSTLGRSKYINGRPTINKPYTFHENVRLLHDEIKRSGGKTVLMMTWARQSSPQHQGTLSNAYMSIGKELGVQVAPVGLVWKEVNERNKDIELFMEDGSHPGPQGTYLVACVMHTTITGKSPIHLPNLVKVPKMSMEGKPVKKEGAYSTIELNQIDVANSHILFSHPLKLNYEEVNAQFKYDFVFTGKFLRGIVKMFFEGVERGISEAQLQHLQ